MNEPLDHALIGKFYEFEDGARIEIMQVKMREEGPLVTYHVTRGNGIPQKLVMAEAEFVNTFAHLFRDETS